jgi:TatA/E family protein of Tat protein translocase
VFTGLESPTHLLLLLVAAVLLFGSKRLPEIGRSLGKGISEFKQGVATHTGEFHEALEPFNDLHGALDPFSGGTAASGAEPDQHEHDL